MAQIAQHCAGCESVECNVAMAGNRWKDAACEWPDDDGGERSKTGRCRQLRHVASDSRDLQSTGVYFM